MAVLLSNRTNCEKFFDSPRFGSLQSRFKACLSVPNFHPMKCNFSNFLRHPIYSSPNSTLFAMFRLVGFQSNSFAAKTTHCTRGFSRLSRKNYIIDKQVQEMTFALSKINSSGLTATEKSELKYLIVDHDNITKVIARDNFISDKDLKKLIADKLGKAYFLFSHMF